MSDWERRVQVNLPNDEDGFLQRSYPNCDLLFAVNSEEYRNARLVNLRCPRCLFVEPFDDYVTPDQLAYAEAHAQDAMHQMAEGALDKLTRDLFSDLRYLRSSKYVKVTGPTGRISLPGTPVPSAIAKVPMTTERCSNCGLRFKTSVAKAIACPVCR
jgi:hypothetical protein